jgi:hypothetical protein
MGNFMRLCPPSRIPGSTIDTLFESFALGVIRREPHLKFHPLQNHMR